MAKGNGSKGGGGDNDVREAIEKAQECRADGEYAEAAAWFRRAAKMLLEEGDDDRAMDYARLAAEMEDTNDPPPPKAKAKSASATGRHKAQPSADVSGRNKAVRADAPTASSGRTGKHKAVREVPSPATPAAPAPKATPPRPAPSAMTAPPRPIATASVARPAMPPPAKTSGVSVPLPRPSVPPPAPPPRSPNTSASSSSLRSGGTIMGSPVPNPNARLVKQPPEDAIAKPAPVPTVDESIAPARPVPVLVPRVEVGAAAPSSTWSIPPPPAQAYRVDYVRARLSSLPGFDELTSERLREVSRQVQVLECATGDVVFRTGDATGPLFVVTSGSVQIDTGGEAALKTRVGDDAAFGAISAVYGDRRLATAKATGPLEAFVFAPSLARSLMRESAALRRFLEGVFHARVVALLPHLVPALQKLDRSVRERLLTQCEVLALEDASLLQLEGVTARGVYVIAAGGVESFGGTFDPGVVHRAGAGTVIGADSLRTDAPAAFTVRATRPTLVARWSKVAFKRAITDDAQVADAFRDSTP